jgi:hypothetical protein
MPFRKAGSHNYFRLDSALTIRSPPKPAGRGCRNTAIEELRFLRPVHSRSRGERFKTTTRLLHPQHPLLFSDADTRWLPVAPPTGWGVLVHYNRIQKIVKTIGSRSTQLGQSPCVHTRSYFDHNARGKRVASSACFLVGPADKMRECDWPACCIGDAYKDGNIPTGPPRSI